ncbi:MAG: thiamine pyrophosphate-requiring protein [Rhodospirillaceae bacterium]
MNGAELVAEILRREGTEFLSCYPRNPLIEACSKIDIRPILCRQERVGVGLADGFSRIRRGRQIGVFAAQQGPGIENAFPGIAQAYTENVPLLVIPAGLPLSQQYKQPTFRAADVFAPVTKWSALAHDISELPGLMRRAYQLLRSGKSGPVLIEIPNSVFDQQFDGALDYVAQKPLKVAPDPAAVEEAVRMLLAADNPIVWAGAGIHYAEAWEALADFAEALPVPVMTTNPGKSALAEIHPLALGASTRSRPRMVSEFMNRADLVFAIGSSLTRSNFNPAMPSGKKIIHSTNEMSDINKDFASALGLPGDAKLVLEALSAEIGRQRQKSNTERLDALKLEIAQIKDKWKSDWSDHLDSDEMPLNQYRVLRDLMATVDRDNTIVTHDSGSPREQTLPFWETTVPGSYMGWGKSTQLGYGLGINMGAKLAAPDKLCINIMGDAAIGMTGMDIETAARNGIGTLTVVFNNAVMAAERDVLVTSTQKYGTLAVGGNYAKVAEGLGLASLRVDRPSDIIPAIKEAMAETSAGRPFLLEFVVKEGHDFSRD